MKQVQKTVNNKKQDQELDFLHRKEGLFRHDFINTPMVSKLSSFTMRQLRCKGRFITKMTSTFVAVSATRTSNCTLIVISGKDQIEIDQLKDRYFNQNTLSDR